MLLYSATSDGQLTSSGNLPVLTQESLKPIEDLSGPTGNRYRLFIGEVRRLHRYKMAASICLDGFVSRNDRPEIIEALTMSIARRIGNAKGQFCFINRDIKHQSSRI